MSQYVLLQSMAVGYQRVMKPILFQFDPELVHTQMTRFGQVLGDVNPLRILTTAALSYDHPMLRQEIAGISFARPVGLAAGFDYEAQLTQILPAIGFGFETVGTITNSAYDGNPRPMLGRLPKSKSLMVNKGFKNLGAKETIKHLTNLDFTIPIGVSIGRTNSRKLVTQQQSVDDILKTFIAFEKSPVRHSYYELNISCPNLFGDVTFYPPKNLHALLTEIDALHLTRPVFIKMPIEKTDTEVLKMLAVIAKHSPVGVIFGNLQKNRNHPSLHPDEVSKFAKGNFSGKPTFARSNELIALAYKHYKDRLVIIGCGGIFSAEDAYLKIRLGASLVQLITGMIFMGPQLITTINRGLVQLLQRDGFTHLSEAVGTQGD